MPQSYVLSDWRVSSETWPGKTCLFFQGVLFLVSSSFLEGMNITGGVGRRVLEK